ncbi:acyl-CoA dehydrogenase family protein [Chondromyces apiculatus]|uniref:FadE30 n=1 Tax=Chondromyces apiculatus DSM 436 TaxID=1192034 RepID=A0A017T837_9BACT|nr:acyl-CoA dehydrogenase family protein [Chondromyces apiculatus]EYF04761.1 FadE30 [Chondromyces apiculatus DSM 436]
MDLSFSPEHLAFREEVRAFIASAMPPSLMTKAAADSHFEHDEVMEWHKILHRKGWVAPHWPAEVGGSSLDVTSRFILSEELELAGAPALSPFGLVMVGPLIIQFGTPEQKKRFLPRILSGEEVWCQGYSEPNAGSDLASLKTRAEDDGKGNFVVTGQKTWTTYAQYADWIFCLVRTDASAKKQSGISFLLIDLKTPGVTVKPFLTSGGTPAFSETFFEGAVVPKENLVGPLNGGWTLAKALLGHERTLIAAVGASIRAIRKVKRIAARTQKDGRPLLEDPLFRAKIARLEIKLRGLQMANYRAIAGAQLGRAPGPESSILKIRGSEIQQQCYELAMEAMGLASMSWFNEPGVVHPEEQWVPSLFNYLRATTIYGGTNEIQKNIIAKLILGIPDR